MLDFIKSYLNIKSNIILVNTKSSFNKNNNTQNLAGVSLPINNTFYVNVNFDDTKTGFVRNLAHELTHVKQIEDGKLKITNNQIIFNNQIININDYKNKYHDTTFPFEEEAYEMIRNGT